MEQSVPTGVIIVKWSYFTSKLYKPQVSHLSEQKYVF